MGGNKSGNKCYFSNSYIIMCGKCVRFVHVFLLQVVHVQVVHVFLIQIVHVFLIQFALIGGGLIGRELRVTGAEAQYILLEFRFLKLLFMTIEVDVGEVVIVVAVAHRTVLTFASGLGHKLY